MNKNIENLKFKAEKFNVNLTDEQLEQFKVYWQVLNDYNIHTNLVSSTEIDVVFTRHFIDSLAVGLLKKEINWDKNLKLIDIGIGGGFPGVPIIIANPNAKLCAVESVGKKVKFLEHLAKELGVSDRVELINSRAEELAFKPEMREQFDVAVTRAVAQLNVISEYCLPFVKTNGVFVAYKAKNIEAEILEGKKAITLLGGSVKEVLQYDICDDDDFERNLVLIKKTKKTPAHYPRKTGIPKKNPL